jgi:hypothetical protein
LLDLTGGCERHPAGNRAGRAEQIGGFASVFFGLIFAALRSSAPLYFREPLGRSASSLSLSNSEALQHDDSFGDLVAFDPKIRQHFVNIHFSSVP